MFIYDTPPCKKCENRVMACHTTCQKYKNWKVEHDLKVAEIEKREKASRDVLASKHEFSQNYLKKTKWRKK